MHATLRAMLKQCSPLISLALCVTVIICLIQMNVIYRHKEIKADTSVTTWTFEGTSQAAYRNSKNVTGEACVLNNGSSIRQRVVDLRIIIITYDRATSLLRALQSLDRARYGGDKVTIDIWIDRSKSGEYSQETVDRAREFVFSQGTCTIHIHPKHVGIKGQWLDTWDPPKDREEMALILEDDLTVSPYFYKYLKVVHSKYGAMPDVAGYSLQGTSVRHSTKVSLCCLEVDNKHKVFLYPTLGTSGFAPNRIRWIRFKTWLADALKNNLHVPLVPEHVASQWYTTFQETGKTDSMWEMEYLYYTHQAEEYTLYPNFKGHRGLTFNWYEDGLHSTGEKKGVADEMKNLVLDWRPEYEQLPNVPVYVDNAGVIIKT